jgi:hypothetical protein
MTSVDRLFVADMVVKSASAAAGLAGMVGPLGTYAYGKVVSPEDEEARYALMGRSALGGSLGGLAGTAIGIPVAMATGLPIIPGMLLSSGLGMLGSGIGSYVGAKRYLKKKKKSKSEERKTND